MYFSSLSIFNEISGEIVMSVNDCSRNAQDVLFFTYGMKNTIKAIFSYKIKKVKNVNIKPLITEFRTQKCDSATN